MKSWFNSNLSPSDYVCFWLHAVGRLCKSTIISNRNVNTKNLCCTNICWLNEREGHLGQTKPLSSASRRRTRWTLRRWVFVVAGLATSRVCAVCTVIAGRNSKRKKLLLAPASQASAVIWVFIKLIVLAKKAAEFCTAQVLKLEVVSNRLTSI